MANPQIRIIDLPLSTDISATVSLEYVAIESSANGGRKMTVPQFLHTGGSNVFYTKIGAVTDRAITTWNSSTSGFRDNPNTTIDASGYITAPGLYTTSSRRYKENINPIYDALRTVNLIQGVRYNRIGNPGVFEIGLIAEDIQWVAPEVVSKNSQGLPEAVDYARLVPFLINAINELAARVESLESRK